jgi:hypothetical protein
MSFNNENNWSQDYEEILEQIRINSVNQAQQHKKKYFFYRQLNKWFRIPTIILSSIGSVASVGLQSYFKQQNVSALTCLISLSVGIINSIEIFLKINETTELELETSKHFYNLATDIHKILGLSAFNRISTPKETLDDMYRRYVELMEKSNLISSQYKDVLISLPKKQKGILSKISLGNSSASSSSSLNSNNPLNDDVEEAKL